MDLKPIAVSCLVYQFLKHSLSRYNSFGGGSVCRRPLPTYRTTHTHRHPFLEWDSNPHPQRSRERTQFITWRDHCDWLDNMAASNASRITTTVTYTHIIIIIIIIIIINGFTADLFAFGHFFSCSILLTVGRVPWMGDQPVARPLPTHRHSSDCDKLERKHGVPIWPLSMPPAEYKLKFYMCGHITFIAG
jgi:hypothetical protein